ncbi:hypothetical protein HYU23_02365 [Candidatus Woesearchaeota archaeon]|nr:hypothetical protein [Candidatus Woesearchaeota archaeon]
MEKEIFSRNIVVTDEVFDIDKIYKGIKKKSGDLGYTFIEKEQATKPGKYGTELKFKFILDKEVDEFGELIFDLGFSFDRLSKAKNLDRGNCEVSIKGKVIFDYKNRWGMNKFNKTLLGLYIKFTDSAMKKKYIVPLILDGNEMHDFIKDSFGFYTS